ncbi:hypothetical protein Xedl_02409 [Xenorhabdus eapokensis]|uniref:Uncharacterized protein n=1 Tax=Xenorhabdus eapokensis TaxID=1873482 RepID=A0A1Q5TPV9_9GAMM|nr:hypothetical protein Xedl_02409 [Xenorhabdus eapokensis]
MPNATAQGKASKKQRRNKLGSLQATKKASVAEC